MNYDLALPREEFDKADRLVRSVLLRSGRSDLKAPNLITSDSGMLLPDDRVVLEDSPASIGHCFGRESQFDIWISPWFLQPPSDAYRETLLHELCHGYLGLYKHNHRWKRFFGRVLYHYSMLVYPIHASGLTETMLRTYTLRGDESYPKFLDRLYDEQETIAKITVEETPHIARMYSRITDKEKTHS